MVVCEGEKAIKKKQICVKHVARSTTEYAVTDLILLSRSKRAPTEYILTGSVSVSFAVSLSVIIIINSIPTSIKNCSSVYSFKRHLKSHLIAQLINCNCN